MATHDLEKADRLSDGQTTSSSSSESNSSSTGGTSPPSTPPDDVQQEDDALPRLQHAPHSSNPPRRGARRSRNGPSTRLGAIDEHSNSVAPDIPTRNPNRIFGAHAARFFGFGSVLRKDEDIPPPNTYDKIIGPRGEKFTDVRRNNSGRGTPSRGRRRCVCILLVVFLILAIALGVGLGVGLTRRKGSNNSSPNPNSLGSPSTNDQFPMGTYAVSTYQTGETTDCTSNSATWQCFPGAVYNSTNPSASFTTQLWQITSPTNSTQNLQISNTNPTFSYPFTNRTLTLADASDPRLSAFSFTFTYRKQVVPPVALTSDGAASRCYYHNTLVSARLYNTAQGAGGNIAMLPSGSSSAGTSWPYAIEYVEQASTAPECFRYSNGLETTKISIGAGSGNCTCAYRNYGLS